MLSDSGRDAFMFGVWVLSEGFDGGLDDSGAGDVFFDGCKSSVNRTDGVAG